MLERHASAVAGLDLLVPRLLRHLWLLRQQQGQGLGPGLKSVSPTSSPPVEERVERLLARKEALMQVFDGNDIDEWLPTGDELTLEHTTVQQSKSGTTAALAPPSIALLLAEEQEGTGTWLPTRSHTPSAHPLIHLLDPFSEPSLSYHSTHLPYNTSLTYVS